MIKIKPLAVVAIASGVAVLGGVGVASARHYNENHQNNQAVQIEQLTEENTKLRSALTTADEEVTALEQKAVAVRIECEKGAIAFGHLTSYQKRLVGSTPVCPPAVATPQ